LDNPVAEQNLCETACLYGNQGLAFPQIIEWWVLKKLFEI
jgi:hypothetical protein